MTTGFEIPKAVRALHEEEFDVFSSWFNQYEEKRCDRHIERDQKPGPLPSLLQESKSG